MEVEKCVYRDKKMPEARFELAQAYCPLEPESSASANSATPACVKLNFLEFQFGKPIIIVKGFL